MKKIISIFSPLVIVLALGILLVATNVYAGMGGSTVPDYPASVTAGQTGVPTSLTITNSATSPNDTENVAVSSITHTPSCGSSLNPGTCTGGDIDTGVFTVHNGTGRAGTACAGTTFTAGAPDASGKVTFTPSAAVILGPSNPGGAAAQCIIDFTVDVLKVPTIDSNGTLAGIQTNPLGSAVFTGQPSGLNGAGTGSTETR